MSESRPAFRHTSGEWGLHPASNFEPTQCGNYEFVIAWISSGEKIIGDIRYSSDGDDCPGFPIVANLEEMKANLALMSAAPNLLEAAVLALKKAEDWIHDQLDGTAGLETALAELEPVRAAIAKATTY